MSQLLFIFMKKKFIDLCKYGNLKEAKLLYEQQNINIHANSSEPFRFACEHGNLEIAKWLHCLGADIHAFNDYAFRWGCYNGHLETAKWLHGLGADIHEKNDLAFRYSCENGHLETAKWLYSLGADIHADNNYAFKNACIYRHVKIVDWFLTLDNFNVKPHFNYTNEINNIIKQHLEYKLKWCNLFGFNKECTKKFSDIYDNSKKEYSKTFYDMFPFSKIKN